MQTVSEIHASSSIRLYFPIIVAPGVWVPPSVYLNNPFARNDHLLFNSFVPPDSSSLSLNQRHSVAQGISIRWKRAFKRRTNEFLSHNLLLRSRRSLSRFCRLKLASCPYYGIILLLLFHRSARRLEIRAMIQIEHRAPRKPSDLNNYTFASSQHFISHRGPTYSFDELNLHRLGILKYPRSLLSRRGEFNLDCRQRKRCFISHLNDRASIKCSVIKAIPFFIRGNFRRHEIADLSRTWRD